MAYYDMKQCRHAGKREKKMQVSSVDSQMLLQKAELKPAFQVTNNEEVTLFVEQIRKRERKNRSEEINLF